MKRAASEGYNENARVREELKELKTKLENERKEIEALKQGMNKETKATFEIERPDFNKILSEVAGVDVKNQADITDIITDDPGKYHEAMLKYNELSNKALATSLKTSQEKDMATRIQQNQLKTKADASGVDYGKMKSWADSRDFPLNEHTLNAFKRENKIESKTDEINKSIINDFTWFPHGDVKPDVAQKSLTEEFPTQIELDRWAMKQSRLPKEQQDPRYVKEFG